jgi:hypothetical protein
VSFETVNVRCSQQWAKQKMPPNTLQRTVGVTELEFRLHSAFRSSQQKQQTKKEQIV